MMYCMNEVIRRFFCRVEVIIGGVAEEFARGIRKLKYRVK